MQLDYATDALLARAKPIALVCFDVDGTLTDGTITFDEAGQETKRFHVHDGMGIALLRRAGIKVAFITARASVVAERRAAELDAQAFTAIKDKRACVEQLAQAHDLQLNQIAFMGDDLVDLAAMQCVGLAVAPANRHAWVDAHAHLITQRQGGQGAARELCDLLLLAQGHAQTLSNSFGLSQ